MEPRLVNEVITHRIGELKKLIDQDRGQLMVRAKALMQLAGMYEEILGNENESHADFSALETVWNTLVRLRTDREQRKRELGLLMEICTTAREMEGTR